MGTQFTYRMNVLGQQYTYEDMMYVQRPILWGEDVCTKDKSDGDMMHVQRTNLMETQCMYT